jgi:hypothetical protein
VEKYRNLTHSIISSDRQAAIESAVLSLVKMEDISELSHCSPRR